MVVPWVGLNCRDQQGKLWLPDFFTLLTTNLKQDFAKNTTLMQSKCIETRQALKIQTLLGFLYLWACTIII